MRLAASWGPMPRSQALPLPAAHPIHLAPPALPHPLAPTAISTLPALCQAVTQTSLAQPSRAEEHRKGLSCLHMVIIQDQAWGFPEGGPDPAFGSEKTSWRR